MTLINPTRFVWKTYQVLLDQNPPVLNTLHEVFAGNAGVKLIAIEVYQTNTPTNAEDVDILVTQDGQAWLYDSSDVGPLLDATKYGVRAMPYNVFEAVYKLDVKTIAAGDIPFLISDGTDQIGTSIDGQEVKAEIRQTSAIAAAARIRCKATYKKLEAV